MWSKINTIELPDLSRFPLSQSSRNEAHPNPNFGGLHLCREHSLANNTSEGVAGMIVPVSSPDPKETGIEKLLGLESPPVNVAGTRTAHDFSERMFPRSPCCIASGRRVSQATGRWLILQDGYALVQNVIRSLIGKTSAFPSGGKKEKGTQRAISDLRVNVLQMIQSLTETKLPLLLLNSVS